MTTDIIRKYREFRKMGVGGIVGQDATTCLALARAEAWAEHEGIAAIIEDETEPWDGDCDAPEYVVCLRLMRHCPCCDEWAMIASLGMIGVNNLSSPYLRQCAAELALEVMA